MKPRKRTRLPTKTVEPLPESEWNFGHVPDHLAHHCWLWEFCRELYLQNRGLREAVEAYWNRENVEDDWRRYVRCDAVWPEDSGADVFTNSTVLIPQREIDRVQIDRLSPGDNNPAGPADMPQRPLTKRELEEIGQKLRQFPHFDESDMQGSYQEALMDRMRDDDDAYGLGNKLLESYAAAAAADRYIAFVLVNANEIEPCSTAEGKSTDPDSPISIFVDWSTGDFKAIKRKILKDINLELEKILPSPSKTNRPRGKPPTKEMNELKRLGAMRLIRHYGGIGKALSFHQQTWPFGDDRGLWSKARSEATRVLKKLTDNLQKKF